MDTKKDTKQYIVNVHWGKFFPGQIITEDELPVGTDVLRSISRGTFSPTDGVRSAPIDDKDAAGWKKRALAFEKDLQEARTATPSAETLTKLKDTETALIQMTGDRDRLAAELIEYKTGSVTRGTYDQLQAQFTQLEGLQKSTQAELDKLKPK